MKKPFILISLFSSLLIFVSCDSSSPNTTKESTVISSPGENIFKEKGCVTCHQPEDKTVGPSLKELSEAYKGNQEGMKAFLREEAPPIVDPQLFPTMQVNLLLTKEMSDKDLSLLTEYILKH